jgi:hypothetical protein
VCAWAWAWHGHGHGHRRKGRPTLAACLADKSLSLLQPASTQEQKQKLGANKTSFDNATEDMLQSSESLGTETLIKLLKNYWYANGYIRPSCCMAGYGRGAFSEGPGVRAVNAECFSVRILKAVWT